MARATGIARSTIGRGEGPDLQRLLEPATLGDPMRLLVWVSKSHAKLAAALRGMGHQVSASRSPNCSNASTTAARSIARLRKEAITPTVMLSSNISTSKSWPSRNVHDFVDKELGKAIPFGVYDIGANVGCVRVGIDHDTAEFAVNAIRRWHETMGRERYPVSDRLMITADGGGSNGSRVRLWKIELQKLADTMGLTLMVCHYPPGTSKWNRIEQRLFCHITQNWRGRPLPEPSLFE